MIFFEGAGRKIQVCLRAPDTLATPLGGGGGRYRGNQDWSLYYLQHVQMI